MSTQLTHNCGDDDRTKSNIDGFGCTVIIIEATDYLPSSAYTIGLWEKFGHPEIICFGFSTNTLHVVVNDVAELVKKGSFIEIGKKYNDFFVNSGTQFVPVNNSYFQNYFGSAIDFYNSSDFPALQLVWTDRNNKFPWEANFEVEFVFKQPLLDRNIDFKFREEKNLGIFTTRQWLDEDKPILRVVHEEDGDWQFLTGDQLPEDIRVVALEELTKRDITLNEVFNLEYGEFAERSFIRDNWRRDVSEVEEE